MKLAIQADHDDPQEYRRPLPGAYLETCDWWDHRTRPWPNEQEEVIAGEVEDIKDACKYFRPGVVASILDKPVGYIVGRKNGARWPRIDREQLGPNS